MRPDFLKIKKIDKEKKRPVRSHAVQSVQFKAIGRDPSQMRDSDFSNKQLVPYRNRSKKSAGLATKINGKTIYFEGTEA